MAWAAPIVGSVVGGLLSSSGSKSSTQTVQKAEPWSGVQPALTELYGSALENFQGPGAGYYPGSTVAPQGEVTNLAQNRLWEIAAQGSPLIGNAQTQANATLGGDYMQNLSTQGLYDFAGADFMNSGNAGVEGLTNTARGDFLNSNPYVDDMFGMAARDVGQQYTQNVMPQLASMYSTAGRYGSDAMNTATGQAQNNYGNTLEDLATRIYGGNYANERGLMQNAQSQLGQFGLAGRTLQQSALGELGTQFGRERANQMTAMGQAPGLRAADYLDVGKALELGSTQDLYAQSLVNADVERFNFGQNAPNNELAFLSSILQGAPMGSSGSTTQSGGGNPLLGALGGFQMGNSISNLIGSTSNPGFPLNNGGFGTGAGFGYQDYGQFF